MGVAKNQRTPRGLRDRLSSTRLQRSRALGTPEVILVGALLGFLPTFPLGLIVVGLSLLIRRVGLRNLGWSREGLKRGVLLGLGAGALYAPLEGLMLWPALRRLAAVPTGPPLDASPVGTSSVPSLAFGLVLLLLVSPLWEESVYRGYMIPRVAGLLGFGGRGWFAGVLLSSLLFGLAHLPIGRWTAGGLPLPRPGVRARLDAHVRPRGGWPVPGLRAQADRAVRLPRPDQRLRDPPGHVVSPDAVRDDGRAVRSIFSAAHKHRSGSQTGLASRRAYSASSREAAF